MWKHEKSNSRVNDSALRLGKTMELIEDEKDAISSCSSKFKSDWKAINQAINQACLEKAEGQELTSTGIDQVRKEM